MTPVRIGLGLAFVAAAVVAAIVSGAVVPTLFEIASEPRRERSIGLFDPHLHLSVADVKTVDPPETRRGMRLWIVTLRVRNDAARIVIDPSRLAIRAGARDGRSFAALARGGSDDRSFDTRLRGKLRPGEGYDQSFAFEIPADATSPFVVVETDESPVTWLPRPVRQLLGERIELGL